MLFSPLHFAAFRVTFVCCKIDKRLIGPPGIPQCSTLSSSPYPTPTLSSNRKLSMNSPSALAIGNQEHSEVLSAPEVMIAQIYSALLPTPGHIYTSSGLRGC